MGRSCQCPESKSKGSRSCIVSRWLALAAYVKSDFDMEVNGNGLEPSARANFCTKFKIPELGAYSAVHICGDRSQPAKIRVWFPQTVHLCVAKELVSFCGVNPLISEMQQLVWACDNTLS